MSGVIRRAPADVALAHGQPELPGLGVLLDDDALADWLRGRLPDEGILGARASYVRLKPGTSCLVALHVSTAEGEHFAHARAERGDEPRRLEKAALEPVPGGALGGRVVIDHDLALTLAPFPIDRRLPGLRALVDPQRRPPALPAGMLQVLAYKPERRTVLRVGTGEAAMLLKVYARAGFDAASLATAAVPPGVLPPVPRALVRLPAQAAIAFEWLAGRGLDSLLGAPQASRLATEAGAALRRLHELDPADGLPRSDPPPRRGRPPRRSRSSCRDCRAGRCPSPTACKPMPAAMAARSYTATSRPTRCSPVRMASRSWTSTRQVPATRSTTSGPSSASSSCAS